MKRARLLHGPAGLAPREAVELEERILDAVQREECGPVLRIWINGWCAVLGRNNNPDDWINSDALDADGVPWFHRDSGGGAVIHHPCNLNYSFFVQRADLFGLSVKDAPSFFLAIVARALAHLDIAAARKGISDLVVDGMKISGNAARVKSRAVLHHGTILLRAETARMSRYLPVPPNRPGVPHEGFVAGLWDLGYPAGVERISEAMVRASSENLGWSFAIAEAGFVGELVKRAAVAADK
ncbi:MAG: lipoate--protein ligase family protein [bacterium]